MNKPVFTALTGIALAQGLKPVIAYLKTGDWQWHRGISSGGMPSSHSAGVSALAAYIGMKRGFRSIDFALSCIFGLVVLYDAMGIRRHAGEIAMDVNDLKVQVELLADQHPGIYHDLRKKKLKEMLGHLPQEVAGGVLLGTIVGLASFGLLRR